MSAVNRSDCIFFIAVIIIGCFALFMLLPSASAEDDYTVTFSTSGSSAFSYNHTETSGNVFNNGDIKYICIKNIDTFVEARQLHYTIYNTSLFTPCVDGDGNTMYSKWIFHDPLMKGASQYGNVTHGYIYSGDLSSVTYMIHFEDYDVSTLEGDIALELTPVGCKYDEMFASSLYDHMEEGDVVLADESSGFKVAGYQSTLEYGCPDHKYNLWRTHIFSNILHFTHLGMQIYSLEIQRVDTPLGTFGSRYLLYDSDYTYFNQTEIVDINETVLINPSACDWLEIYCYDYRDFLEHVNVTDLCEVPEPGYFNLSGYTRSIYGNLIPSVKLDIGSDIEYSDNTGFYKFENLETGSYTLAWNKTGYQDDSISFYVGTPFDREHDIYLIPLDALDEGEFGGVIYDYCTLQPMQGAYVYLFNETADSGKYVYSNKYGFYRFAGLTEGLEYQVSASKEGYVESVVYPFTFNESNLNETFCKTKNLWLLPEGGCPEDEDGGGGVPTASPSPTPTPHEWTNEEIVSWLRVNLMGFFIIVFIFAFMWFIRRAGGSKR